MPQKNNYYEEREKYNLSTLNRLLQELPIYCRDYFLAISQSKQILTRVAYCRDILIFFKYICKELLDNETMPTKNVSWEVFSSITADDIDRYMDYLNYYVIDNKEYHNGEDGKARKIAAISTLYAFFVKRERLTSNPVDKVERPALHKKNIITMNQDQIFTLINMITSGDNLSKTQLIWHEKTVERDIAIVMISLGTGIRVSELVGLDLNDIDFEDRSLRIVRKGGDEDIVYFNEDVDDAIRAYIEKTKKISYEEMPEPIDVSARQLLLPSPNSKNPALFISRNGTRMSVRSVERMVKKYCTGVVTNKKITPHKLRSTFATQLQNTTHDLLTTKEVLGHKNVQTTLRYAEYDTEKKRAAAEVVSLKKPDPTSKNN